MIRLEFFVELNNTVHAQISRSRKLPMTGEMRAEGSNSQNLSTAQKSILLNLQNIDSLLPEVKS